MSTVTLARGAVALATLSVASFAAAQVNVALNRPVSVVTGTFNGVSLSTVTDGLFLPRGSAWNVDTVFWDGFDATLQIDLGGSFEINSAIAQVDDNDAYVILYRDLNTGDFLPLWDVPNFDALGSGMQTRPNPDDDTERFFFPGGPVTTDAVRFAAVSGDSLNSVSELQVFSVPAPSAAIVLMLGSAACTQRRRRQS